MNTFKNISELRANLDQTFDAVFFARKTSKFHGDKRRYWSVKNQWLEITRNDGSKSFYKPVDYDGIIKLRVKQF